MCGFVGFFNTTGKLTAENFHSITINMSNRIIHRGPDDSGIWFDVKAGISLGHRRLSIIDLSAEGHQPMLSASGRYVIVFNGEIYNFKILRDKLIDLGYSFRGHSDTEVMLCAIEMWGLEKAVKSFVGMFAFVLWDRFERSLYLCRDRIGEKPLYYGWMGNSFLFGSELKALKRHPDFKEEIDRDSLSLFFRHSYIPAPYSIYKNIYKLPPGKILELKTCEGNIRTDLKTYWDLKEFAEQGSLHPYLSSESELINGLDNLLRNTIKQQMVSDVPIGAFLSGGIDSSTVVALMQAQSLSPIKTFTIGFNEEDYNEAIYAKNVANYLGTDHIELNVTSQQAMDVIPKLPELYDEPFSDSSQIPTFLVCELARKHVTVTLSGDGGDELFAGYRRYFIADRIWSKIKWCPKQGRKFLADILVKGSSINFKSELLSSIFAESGSRGPISDKLLKLAEVVSVDNFEMLYQRLISHWKNTNDIVIGSKEPLTVITDNSLSANVDNIFQRMMYFDMLTYLPDDILVKVDRASMGTSLESRVPLLDHRIIEFALNVPPSMNIQRDKGKALLRKLLYRYVPEKLIERPKMGFGVPLKSWLRGPLREWAESLLDEKRLVKEGYLNSKIIRKMWIEHLSGEHNWHTYLWDVLMFQAWIETNSHSNNDIIVYK